MKFFAMAGLVVTALALTHSAHAQLDEICPKIGDTAEAIMGHRQDGGVMSRLMALANAASADEFYGLNVEMIKLAYSSPQYFSPEMKQRAIIDFRNEMELSCYTSQD